MTQKVCLKSLFKLKKSENLSRVGALGLRVVYSSKKGLLLYIQSAGWWMLACLNMDAGRLMILWKMFYSLSWCSESVVIMSPPVPLSLEALGSAFSSLHRDSQSNWLARQFSPWQFSEGRSEFHKCVHHVAQLLSDKQAQLTKQSSRPKVVNKSGAEQSFTTPVYQEIGFASTAWWQCIASNAGTR